MALTSSQLVAQTRRQITEIHPVLAKQGLVSGAVKHIVDVRERDEVMDGYIAGASFIPRGFLELSVEEDVTADRDAAIVLYCAVGSR